MKRLFWLLVVNEYLSERSQHPPYNLNIVFSLFSFIALDCIHDAVPAYHSTTLGCQCGMMDANGELEKSSDTIILQQEKELQWQPKFENDYFSKA